MMTIPFTTHDYSKAGVEVDFHLTAGVGNASVSTFAGTRIPNRTAITVASAYGVVGDDTTDNRTALLAAMAATPKGGVCLLPAGNIKASGEIYIKEGITLRGAGMRATILKAVLHVSRGDQVYQWNYDGYSTAVVSGATAGSDTITVDNATDWWFGSIEAGDMFVITEVDDMTLVTEWNQNNWGVSSGNGFDGGSGGANRHRGQVCLVESRSGNVVTLVYPLASSFTATPKITRPIGRPWVGTGIESLTVYANGLNDPVCNVIFENARNCWMYDVFSDFCTNNHLLLKQSLNCTIQKCYFYDSFQHTAGSDGEVGVKYFSTLNLVMDCIMDRIHTGFMFAQGASGNVLAYCYIDKCYDVGEADGNRIMQIATSLNHGAHPELNLVEGCLTPRLVADDYWGTSARMILFANFVTGTQTSRGPYNVRGALTLPIYDLTTYRRAIDLWRGQWGYVVVGNVIGDHTMSDAYFKVIAPGSGHDNLDKNIWALGYPGNNNDEGPLDRLNASGPSATYELVDHANWDAVNGTQTFDSGIADHTLANSLFLTNAELIAWKGSSSRIFNAETWDPDPVAEEAARMNLPAYARWVTGIDPGPDGGGGGGGGTTGNGKGHKLIVRRR